MAYDDKLSDATAVSEEPQFIVSKLENYATQRDGVSLTRAICITLTCFTATAMNAVALTSASIALPTIGRDLNIPPARLQWVVTAFALSSGCFLLLFGRLADLYGRKPVFVIGSAWMALFALGGGLARTEIQVNVLRGLQGVGSAATVPAALGILAHTFPPSRERSVAFATFSAGAPFGGVLGYLIGGVVTQLAPATWRGTFFLCAGLSALATVAGLLIIPGDESSTESDRRVDWVGAALVTIGLVFVMFVLGQGELAPQRWRTGYIIALLVIGVLMIGAFLLWEHYLVTRTTRKPLMRLDLWTRANGKFAAMQCIAFLAWCSFMSWMLWAQLYYQNYMHYSPVGTSIRFLPMAVTGLLLNVFVSVFVGRISVIWLLILGTIATGGACLLFAVIDTSATYWAFGFPAAILSVGGADFIFACGTIFVARVAHPHEQSVAGGLFQTLTQLGTAFGIAITTIVSDTVTRRETVRAGLAPDAEAPPAAVLAGYKAAQWAGLGFALAALLLAVVFLRGVGIIGGAHSDAATDTKATLVEAEKRTPVAQDADTVA